MTKAPRRTIEIYAIGWTLAISNVLLFFSYYYILMTSQTPAPSRLISFFSMLAVFPEDFFHFYLAEVWLPHFFWIFMMFLCSFGLLLFNQFSRKVFIVLNVLHITILVYIVFMERREMMAFLASFFKLYFNLVVSGSYIGFLTIPEVRTQFKASLEGIKIKIWFRKKQLEQSSVKDALGYYNLGLAYHRLERYSDAVEAFQKAITLNPGDERFHYGVALPYLKLRRSQEAVSALKEVIRLNPINLQAYHQLGQAYMHEGCHQEAIACFIRATHVHPDNAETYKNLGVAHMAVGHHPQALAAFQKAMALNSRDDFSAFQAGVLLSGQEQFKEALEPLRRAVNIKPDLVEAQFHLGCVYNQLGRYKDALRALKEVIRRQEDHARAHYELGRAYAMLKDFDSAQREYVYLKKVDGDLAESLKMLF